MRGAARVGRPAPLRSDREHAGADQVGELRALPGVEHRVDLPQRLDHRVAQAFCALDAQVAAFLGPGFVELLEAQPVGERGHRAAIVHRRLGAFGLQLVEDLRQLRDLLLVEVELVGEEPQRPPDAEGAASAEVVTAVSPRSGLPAFTLACARAFAAAVPAARVLPPPHHAWVHASSNSPRLFAPGGDSQRGRNASRYPCKLTPGAAVSITRRVADYCSENARRKKCDCTPVASPVTVM